MDLKSTSLLANRTMSSAYSMTTNFKQIFNSPLRMSRHIIGEKIML